MSDLKIITRTPFRGSFCHLTEPSLPQGETDEAKARYQITIALPKKDPFWKEASAAVKAAATEKWGKIPAKFQSPIKDGDNNLDDDGNLKYPEHEGCYTLQASSKRKPGAVGPDLKPIMTADELYSGAWYRATVRAFHWTHPTGGKGVSFSLENVMKVKDDDPLGSAASKPEDDFASFAEAPVDGDEGEEDAANILL